MIIIGCDFHTRFLRDAFRSGSRRDGSHDERSPENRDLRQVLRRPYTQAKAHRQARYPSIFANPI
jgi:hypothetical protein